MNDLRFKYFDKDNFNVQCSEFLRAVRSHPDIVANVFHSKKITRVEQEYWYENDYSKNIDWKIYIIYDQNLNCPIGYVNLNIDSILHRRCQFDYQVSPEFFYRKYDKRIIKWAINNSMKIEIEMHRLWCYVFPEYAKKINILSGMNFEIDGIIRDYIYKDGMYRNVYIMSKLLS